MIISEKLKPLLLSIIFLLPLMGTYKEFGYEHIKVLFFLLSISLIGFLWKGKGFKWAGISKAAGVFIVSLLITSLLGINPKASFLGTQPYFQGFIFYSYLFLFSLMVSWAKIKIENWAIALSGSASLVSLLAIKDWIFLNIFHQQIPAYAGRVVSTFGQPNFYAGFLLLVLPFSYLLFKSKNTKLQILGWGSGLILILGILVSYSRLAILLALFLLILGLITQLKHKLIIAGFALLILFVALIISYKFSSGVIGSEFIAPLQIKIPYLLTDSLEKRVYIWPILWQQFIEKPFLGYGLENISLAFSSYKPFTKYSELLFLASKDLVVDRSHNYILDLLLFSGIFGALAWVIVIMLNLTKLLKSNRQYKGILIVSLLAYLTWIQFQNQSIVQLVYFWLLVGIIDS